MRYFDEMSQNWVVAQLTEAGGFLLGRRTYEILAGYCRTRRRRSRWWGDL